MPSDRNAQDHLSPVRRQGVHRQVDRLPLPASTGSTWNRCCASAAVLLAKPRSFVEIINDLDEVVMGMWRAIKSQPEQLAALLWATPYTAANWREQPVGDIDQAVLADGPGCAVLLRQRQFLHMVARQVPGPAQAEGGSLGRLVPAGAARRQPDARGPVSCTKMPWSQSSGSTVTPKP